MKNKTLTLTVMAMIVFIAITIQIQAQSGDSKKWTTEQAVDFVACSFVRIPHPSEIRSCDETDLTTAKLKNALRDAKAKGTLDLIVEFEGMRNGVRARGKRDVYLLLTRDIFAKTKEYPLIAKFVAKREEGKTDKDRKDLQALRDAIEKNLKAKFFDPDVVGLAEAMPKATPMDSPSGSSNSGEGVSTTTASPSVEPEQKILDFLSVDFAMGVVIGLVFASLGFFAFRITRKGRRGKKYSGSPVSGSTVESNKSGDPYHTAERRPNIHKGPSSFGREKQLEAKIQDLEQKLKEKQREVDSLTESIPTPEVSAGYATPVVDFPQAEPVAASSGSVRSLYFPAPTPDGLFDSRYASSSRIEGESLYVLRLISEVEAEVEFDNSRISVNKAKNSPEQILDPVCEGTRSPMNTILGIRMTAPGKARLEGDDWRVYEKVKLTYEY